MSLGVDVTFKQTIFRSIQGNNCKNIRNNEILKNSVK